MAASAPVDSWAVRPSEDDMTPVDRADVVAMLKLGLGIHDLEILWGSQRGVDMDDVCI